MSRNILMISEAVLKERSIIHDNIDPKLIFPDIKAAQDLYIEPVLGTTLFNKILDLISAGTITDGANVDYKNLLDNYIIDALIYYTLAEMPVTLSYQFWNKGIKVKTADNTADPSMSDMVDISNRNRNKAEAYAQRMTYYLRQHATSAFLPEYLIQQWGLDVIQPKTNDYTVPVYLGDNGCCIPVGSENSTIDLS